MQKFTFLKKYEEYKKQKEELKKENEQPENKKANNKEYDIESLNTRLTNLLRDDFFIGHREQKILELIQNGADINTVDNSGHTALMYACENNKIELLQVLIKSGADINVKSNVYANNALYYACRAGFSSGVKCLIDGGADLNEKNCDGWTALMVAAANGHILCANYLVENGADISLKNNNGLTAIDLVREGFSGLANYLEEQLEKQKKINQDNEYKF